MSTTSGSVLSLDHQDKALLDDLITQVEQAYPGADDPAFLEDITLISQELPLAIRRSCSRQRLRQDVPYLLFRQPLLSSSPVGMTPLHWREVPVDVTLRQDLALVLIASLLGDVFGWAHFQHGRVLADVLPMPGYEYEQVSGSSAAELQWHTEDAAHDDRPDYVGLFALRNDQEIPTTLAFVDDLKLAPETARMLSEPRYVIWPDPSHDADDGPPAWYRQPVPVLSGEPGRWLIRADPPCMSTADGDLKAENALRELLGTVEDAMQEVVIGTGDCCIIDNRRAVHGRRAFPSRYDGRDRWLRRVCASRDIGRDGPASAVSGRLREWTR